MTGTNDDIVTDSNAGVVRDDAPADGAVVHHDSHGQTPAAWTLVGIIMIAFAFGGVAVLIGNWTMFWIGGVGLTVLGAIVGKAMSMLGYGKHSAHQTDELPASVG